MSDPADTEARAAELRALHEARVAAELAAADALCPGSDAVAANGSRFAAVVLVKGGRGPAEESGGPALSGADGAAAEAALERLGYDARRVFRTLSRPEPGGDPARRAERLRLQVESIDPDLVMALDPQAAEDLTEAFGIAPLRAGEPIRVLGRTVVAVDGLEASLGDDARKRVVWEQMRSVARRDD